MKTTELRKALRAKAPDELHAELLSQLKEQFTLRLKRSTGGLRQTHLFKQTKRRIALIKTLLAEKAAEQN